MKRSIHFGINYNNSVRRFWANSPEIRGDGDTRETIKETVDFALKIGMGYYSLARCGLVDHQALGAAKPVVLTGVKAIPR